MDLMHAYFFHNATTPAVINVTYFYVYRPVHTMQLVVQKNRMKHIASCLICILCHWILQFCQKHCLVKLHKLFVTLRILLKLKEHHTSCYRKKLKSTNRISTNQILGFSVIPRESKKVNFSQRTFRHQNFRFKFKFFKLLCYYSSKIKFHLPSLWIFLHLEEIRPLKEFH